MRKIFTKWRYYNLGRDEYRRSMGIAFSENISNLRWASMVVAILTAFFAIFPVVTENDYIKAGFYLESTVIALLICIFAGYLYHQFKKKNVFSVKLVYTLILLFYANVIMFALYLAVWANPGKIAGSFIGIFICALFLCNISPILYLCLTLGTVISAITCFIWFKIPSVWNYDIQNTLFSGIMTLIFGWQIIKNRLTAVSYTSKLENERNKYYVQSTIDELTQLKNRRDFMQTFQRFHSNYRQSDKFLFVAIMDIDFFKNYNDYYGHPKGDDVLSSIGKSLKDLNSKSGIYAARIGGEEFALLWFDDNTTNANNVASNINKMIFDLKIPHEKSNVAPFVTVSIGLHIWRCGASGDDIHSLYKKADKALYAAKTSGRNRAVISS